MRTNTTDTVGERVPVETGMTVTMGLEVHARQITVCRQMAGCLPQAAYRRSEAELLAEVMEYIKGG